MTKASRARLRRTLPKKLGRGWQRAVFASPERADGSRDEEVLNGPGELHAEEDSTDASAPIDGERSSTQPDRGRDQEPQHPADRRQHSDPLTFTSPPPDEQDATIKNPPEPLQDPSESGPAASGETLDAAIAELLDAAETAARSGLVKQTIVLDDRRRLVYDARHGHLKLKTLDAATRLKVMGGKQRLFRPDTSARFLRTIGIMNADGTISTRHARKYKQVSHLAELCRPTWERVQKLRPPSPEDPLRVLDLACGNAYLSFVLAEALRLAAVPLRLHGVDVRDDVIARARERAQQLEIQGLSFARATIAQAYSQALGADALAGRPDIVVALHACDTATDEALELAIRSGTPAILCVPCCQHELSSQLASQGTHNILPALLEHGLLRRAYADVLTDSIRCELLRACGYQVDVVEFVDSEHSAKNLLIRAARRHRGIADPSRWRLTEVADACAKLGVDPCLLRLLQRREAQAPPAP